MVIFAPSQEQNAVDAGKSRGILKSLVVNEKSCGRTSIDSLATLLCFSPAQLPRRILAPSTYPRTPPEQNVENGDQSSANAT